MARSYHEQFRDNQQMKNPQRANTIGKIAFGTKVPPRRPPELRTFNGKQSPRSDSSPNHRNSDLRAPRQNDYHQPPPPQPRRQVPPPPPPPPQENRRYDTRRPDGAGRVVRHSDPVIDSAEARRRPLRFGSNDPLHRPLPPPARDHSNPAPPPAHRVSDREYVIERRRRPTAAPHAKQAPVYVYEDYRDGTPVETASSPRIIRVVRDRPYRDPDDVYYVDAEPSRVVYATRPRRSTIVRRSSPTEYVYVDEAPTTAVRRRERLVAAPAPRKEVIYVDEPEIVEEPRRQAKVEYVDEYVYVDEKGHEIEVVRDKDPSASKYVEYVYDDELEQRRAKPSRVVYVDNDGKSQKKSKQSSTTRVVYD